MLFRQVSTCWCTSTQNEKVSNSLLCLVLANSLHCVTPESCIHTGPILSQGLPQRTEENFLLGEKAEGLENIDRHNDPELFAVLSLHPSCMDRIIELQDG